MDSAFTAAVSQFHCAASDQIVTPAQVQAGPDCRQSLESEGNMKDQNSERRKRSIKLGLLFGLLVLFVYAGSMYLLWA